MSTILRPVGPQPPQVYWTRRLVVLGAIVVVLVLLWAVLAGGGAADAASEPDTQAATGDNTEGDGTEQTTQAPATCTAVDLKLQVATDAGTYPAGAQPVLAVTITNIGTADCTVDAGDASREVLITSGSDRIWSSLDCAGEGAERLLLLPAGAQDTTGVTWTRVRSVPGCTAGLTEPRAGTYNAVVTLLGVESEPAVFQLD